MLQPKWRLTLFSKLLGGFENLYIRSFLFQFDGSGETAESSPYHYDPNVIQV